jgi:hypothetical protein
MTFGTEGSSQNVSEENANLIGVEENKARGFRGAGRL